MKTYPVVKRVVDVAAAAVLLAATAPLLAAVAALVRVTMGRPVLYRQPRPGRHGVLFNMAKFRTMRAASGSVDPESDALRLTAVGRWLRAASLDELPTLYHVLRGQMSLVGPRPLLPEYLDRYTAEQARRHEVRPGVTGLAQVSGRNELSWKDKLRLDVRYVDELSLRLDVTILARTVVTVLRRDGINAAGHASMPAFQPAPKTEEIA
jgi:lipopolysaccharide/colanic/teichoic acid biosynthesis glycosyltransferase